MIGALLRLYPRSWRDRYEDEYRAVLEQTGVRPATVVNVALHAGAVRVRHHQAALTRLAALLVFALAEAVAISAGYTENILWMPRSPASLVLLAAAVSSLAMVVAPLFADAGRLARKVVRR